MKRLACIGGGSGGHVFPLFSLISQIDKKSSHTWDVFFIGEKNGQEEGQCGEKGIKFLGIYCHKFPRYPTWEWLKIPILNSIGFFQALWILKKNNIDIVFAKGSHVSPVVIFAAYILGIPSIIHESDAHPGLANKLNGLVANTIFLGSNQARGSFKKRNSVRVVGQILDPIFQKSIITKSSVPAILIIGGSQGARFLFQSILEHIHLFDGWNIFMVLGSKNGDLLESCKKHSSIHAYMQVSQEEMFNLYSKVQACISRPGANSGAELLTLAIPCLFVPMDGKITNNHQLLNAQEFATYGAWYCEEKDLITTIPKFIASVHEVKKAIGENYKKMDAAGEVIKELDRIVK